MPRSRSMPSSRAIGLLVFSLSCAGLLGCGDSEGDAASNHSGIDAGADGANPTDGGVSVDADGGEPTDAFGPDGSVPPYRVPDTPSMGGLKLGDGPGVIFRWRADGTSTSPGVLSSGVGDVTVERPSPFSSFRYAEFKGVPTGPSPGYLGDKAIAAQPEGFTVQAWFRAAPLDGTRTLFSNTGASKGWSVDVRDGALQLAFSTSEGGSPYRHWIRDDSTPIVAGQWTYVAASASLHTDHWRVAFFVDGILTYEEEVPFDHGSALVNSAERAAVGAEPGGGGLDGEGFDGDIHAVVVHNYPVGDDILGTPHLREGGRTFGAPSYHDYLQIPEPAGTAAASPPYSDRRYNLARRIALTDHDARFDGLRSARARLGLPFLNDKYVPSGVSVSDDGTTMWMGYHFELEEGGNPDGNGSFVAEVDLPSRSVAGVYRLLAADETPFAGQLGGVVWAHASVYVSMGNRVMRFALAGAELESPPDPDLSTSPSFYRLGATDAFDVNVPDAAMAYDPERDALWLSGSSSSGSALERYDFTAEGAIAHPSSSVSDESLELPASVRFVRGVVPLPDAWEKCFLLTSYDVADEAGSKASRIYRWCLGRPAAAARLDVSAGAQALALGPDATVWTMHQSGARSLQKRKTAAQWYDVLTPYVVGYEVSAFDPKKVGCETGEMSPYLGDLHTHTSYSDGIELPKDLFEEARVGVGLDFAIVTDHGAALTASEFSGCRTAASAATEADKFLGLCGFEVSIKSASGSTLGHSNILFPADLFPYPPTLAALYDRLSDCDGCLAQINHPASEKYPWTGNKVASKADATVALAELNGNTADIAVEKYFALLDGGWHVAPSWNSDTHALEPSKGGRRTGVLATSLDEADIKAAIAARRTFAGNAGNGAFITLDAEGCWMGVRLQGYLAGTFTVQAVDAAVGFDSIELLSNGGALVHTWDCAGQTTCTGAVTLEVDPAEQSYVVAYATRSDGKWMLSAPVWLEN